MGSSKKGSFDVPREVAVSWLARPNPHGKSNGDVLKPIWNGIDLTSRQRSVWIVDFGTKTNESDAALYEAPFDHVRRTVKPERDKNNRELYRKFWWRHAEARPGMRAALLNVSRFIATPHVSKHRLFAWLPTSVLPDQMLLATARADDATFGILHSRFHELWSLRMCTWLGVGNDPRYTPTTCFETFPFPAGLTPRDTAHQRTEALEDGAVIPADLARDVRNHAITIARTAKRLNDLRERWLNPPEWTEAVPEVIPLGMAMSPYPDRILPRANLGAADLAELKKRTLTNLYNQRPAWLADAHTALDAAVAAAYGWADCSAASTVMTDNEILARLLALNLERSAGNQRA